MPYADLMAAAGFASGWMLLWAAAGAIPIVIHFLTRRRQVTVGWAAMQLLLAVIEKEAKRVRLEQLLLLMLRVLVLLTLTLALARPFLSQNNLVGPADRDSKPKLWIIAVDTSVSMGYRPGETSRFQVAKEQAIAIVESSQQGDAFALLEAGSPCRAIIRRPSFDKSKMLAELRKMKLLDTGCDALGWLQQVREIMADAQASNSLPRDIRVVLYTDLGRDSWDAFAAGPNAKSLTELNQQVPLEIVSLASSETSNVAITAFHPSLDRVKVGHALDVMVQVVNYGAEVVKQLPIQLTVDDQTVESRIVELAAGESKQVQLSLTPKSLGKVVIKVTIPNDALVADNERRYVIEVCGEDRILFVEGSTGNARLMSLSLAPSSPSRSNENFRTISSIDLLSFDLTPWDAVVLCDLATMDRGGVAKLTAFVKSGGGLIAAFGPDTRASIWNESLQESDLLGYQFEVPSAESNWAIDALDYRSPIVAPFAGFPDAGLLTTPIFRYWTIRPSRPATLITDLALTNGAPLIVRKRTGRGWAASILSKPDSGRTLASSTGSTASWNAIATWPSFVPLMQQLSQSVLDSNAQEHNLLAGQPLRGELSSKAMTTVNRVIVTLTCPDGSESEVIADELPSEMTMPWQFSRTQISGVYQAREPNGSMDPFAVNVDTAESSLESISPSRLPARPNWDALDLRPTELSNPQEGQRDQLARNLLWLLLLLLVSESICAWWIGRRIG